MIKVPFLMHQQRPSVKLQHKSLMCLQWQPSEWGIHSCTNLQEPMLFFNMKTTQHTSA